MVDLIALGILVLIIVGIMKAASGRRYEEMTEEEFEAEAKRSSAMGAAVSGLQKVVNPSHDSEHIIEQQQRIEAERTNSGDRRSWEHPRKIRIATEAPSTQRKKEICKKIVRAIAELKRNA